MSRGGRGGGRGRGGGSRGKARIAGQDMNWDYDPDISAPSEPQQMFPNMGEDFPKVEPPSRRERDAVHFFKATRERIYKGPLHAVLNDKARISKDRQAKRTISFNPFNDMPRYSEKYKRPQRELPCFTTRAYPHFFPEELLGVLEPKRAQSKPPKKLARRRDQPLNLGQDEEDEDAEEQQVEDDEDKPAARKPDEDEEPEEVEPDPDETYEDDEDEMAGDYNAEGYFSGGEGDDDDVAMGADDGGADFD